VSCCPWAFFLVPRLRRLRAGGAYDTAEILPSGIFKKKDKIFIEGWVLFGGVYANFFVKLY